MESTADKLEKMDGTSFEQFCGPVLRKMKPELAGFLPSGINEEGKTIRSLMDGFYFISNVHMATVHITTTKEKNLATKWLYDGDAPTMTKGDLVKAIKQARDIHNGSPHFQFTIFLVYNGRVPDDLQLKAHQLIIDPFISLKIIERRDIIPFLDLEPEGQYLRYKLLDITADRISRPLLNDITADNLYRYAHEYFLEQENITMTSLIENVEQQINSADKFIHLLTGDSGFGKSSICLVLLQKAVGRGSAAIRISPTALERALSLEDAIWQQLIIDHPNLYPDPKTILSLFEKGFVVIDDINKTSQASVLLDKVISWGGDNPKLSCTVLCPVWPRNINGLDDKAKKEDKFHSISLRRPSFYDCKKIIERRMDRGMINLTDQQIHSLILDTGFDPLLLDFSLDLLTKQQQFSDRIASNAISRFVTDKIQVVHRDTQMPIHSIRKALIVFGKAMLQKSKMNPHLKDLEKWVGAASEEYKILYMIAAQRQLFLFSDDGQCHFRHDRVLDHLLMSAVMELLANPEANEMILEDPFYAEIIAAAISEVTLQKDTLNKLAEANPLAVFGSQKYLQGPSHESNLKMITDVCESWSSGIQKKHIPKSVTNEIAYVLTLFDVKDIQIITKGFPNNPELQLAKFRNGEWNAGILFLKSMNYFYPESPSYWWGTVLTHVKAKYLEQHIQEFQQALTDPSDTDNISHLYTLAGFYRDTRLTELLRESWKKYQSRENYIAYLWAIINCSSAKDTSIVQEVLSYFNGLTNDQKFRSNPSRLPGGSLISLIEQINWEFKEKQLAVFFQLSADAKLQEILALLLARTDHPDALSIVLNKEMTRNEDHYGNVRNDERWDNSKKSPKLSEASRNYLLQEFSDVSNHPMRRYVAWRFWTGNVEAAIVLQKLQQFTAEEDHLTYHSILWRADHHDHTAFPGLKKFIDQKPWLIHALDDIWNNETAEFFEQWFEARIVTANKEEIEFGLELMDRLDNAFAVALLIKHWEQLRRYARALNLALFLSSPETIKLADAEIKRLGFTPGQRMPRYYHGNLTGAYISWNDGIPNQTKEDLHFLSELFKLLGWYYGVKYSGKPERLTRKKIETLIPYLELMDLHNIQQFASRCIQIGAPDLCYNHFYPLLGRHERSRIRPTQDDIRLDLIHMYKELEKNGSVYPSYWMIDGIRLSIAKETLREAIQTFLNEYKNAKALFIVGMALERFGTRDDIAIMESFQPEHESDNSSVIYWRENAKFLIRRRSLH